MWAGLYSEEMSSESLENLATENRSFSPTPEFAAAANAQPDIYKEADADGVAFWEKQAEALTWNRKWDTALEWKAPHAKWFKIGRAHV